MLIGQVVKVHDLWAAGLEDTAKLVADGGLLCIADGSAVKAKLGNKGILPDDGRGLLFANTFGCDLLVTPLLKLSGAGTTPPIGDGHASEPAVVLVVAGEDAMKGHELQVVLMGADAKVGGAADGVRDSLAVRNREASERVQLDHRRRAGREAAAMAWPWRLSFSSGTTRSIRSSGNSSTRTARAFSMMVVPPWPEVTRPMIRRQLIS